MSLRRRCLEIQQKHIIKYSRIWGTAIDKPLETLFDEADRTIVSMCRLESTCINWRFKGFWLVC